jgi:hypothetical protein
LSGHEQEPDARSGERPTGEESERPAEQDPALPPKRFRAATDAELDPQSFIVSDDRIAARATIRDGSIGTNSGDAHFIGNAMRGIAGALREAAKSYAEGMVALPSPLLRSLAFEHSVTLEFEISEAEEIQVDLDNVPHSPTLDAARTKPRLALRRTRAVG